VHACLHAHKLTKHSLHRHTGITSHSLATDDCTVNVAQLSSPGRLEEFLDYVFPRRTFSLQLTKNTDKCCTSCTENGYPRARHNALIAIIAAHRPPVRNSNQKIKVRYKLKPDMFWTTEFISHVPSRLPVIMTRRPVQLPTFSRRIANRCTPIKETYNHILKT